MDKAGLVGTVASVIAAIGVVWERWHWWRTRPWSLLTVVPDEEPHDRPRDLFEPDHGHGCVATLINWGTERAFGVGLVGMHCKVGPATRGQSPITEMAERSEVKFFIEVAPREVERAWILVTWSSPASRSARFRTAWFPVLESGELARVRERQLRWRSLPRRAMLRLAIGRLSSPATRAFGSARARPSTAPSVESLRPIPELPRWWRRVLLKRLQAAEEPIVSAAMELV